jgi:hypothetical protein
MLLTLIEADFPTHSLAQPQDGLLKIVDFKFKLIMSITNVIYHRFMCIDLPGVADLTPVQVGAGTLTDSGSEDL